ncbi:MAG: cytochrome C oxidase subunit II [Lysobacterales bacterium 63-13]|jgi:cytochrome c oxidase subunit 2|nr:MAG: cytochrome C oxidase subunit II [Xanthomonadales bacterium 63-13]
MSAILPPTERLWWKHPLDRVEGTWIAIAFVWCMIMFFMMIYWHIYGKQNLSTETYKTTTELFASKTQAMVDKYTVRTETDLETPVVAPPPGSDVYMIARLWNFWPILELQNGQTYRLHLSSMDYNHGFSLQPANINIQIVPGYEHVVTIVPNQSGTYSVVCNEFCGIGHHTMVGRIYIKGETGNVP